MVIRIQAYMLLMSILILNIVDKKLVPLGIHNAPNIEKLFICFYVDFLNCKKYHVRSKLTCYGKIISDEREI